MRQSFAVLVFAAVPGVLGQLAPTLASPLPSRISMNQTITFGLDIVDADSDTVTVTAVSDNPGFHVMIPSGNRFAKLNFVDHNDAEIGSVLVQLFETRGGAAAQRFVALSTMNFDDSGSEIPGADPFYTNVLVHRVIPGFVIQTGDAQRGDGFGGSNLGDFDDQFELQDGLAFESAGVLAMANSGPDTNDNQFFITDGTPTHLNGKHMIFGHVISGSDVVEAVINVPRNNNGRPNDPPKLASVEILEHGQDATITITAAEKFTGKTAITLTLTDDENNQTEIMFEVVKGVEVIGNAVDNNLGQSEVEQAISQVLDGDTLYVAGGGPGIHVYNVSSPTSPQFLGSFGNASDNGTTRSLAIVHYDNPPRIVAFVADGVEGLVSLDVTDPAAITALTRFPGVNAIHVVVDHQDLTAYVAAANNGFLAFDVADPATLNGPIGSITATIGDNPATFVATALNGNVAYATILNFGMAVIDISNPAVMDFGATTVLNAPWGIVLEGSRLLVATQGIAGAGSGLFIFDVADAAEPDDIGFLPLERSPWQVAADTSLAVVGHSGGGFSFIDVTDGNTPEVLFETISTTGAKPLIRSEIVLMSAGGEGVIVIDRGPIDHADITAGLNGKHIADGDAVPIDFGSVPEGGEGTVLTFSVINDGADTLVLGNIDVPAGYTVTEGLASTLPVDSRDTFSVRLNSENAGVKNGNISIATNDRNENPFTFAVTGNVIAPAGICGRKWRDDNGNAIQDAGEPGVSGVTIYVDLDANGAWDSDNEPFAITAVDDPLTSELDETGFYAIRDLAQDSYTIRELAPQNSIQTFPGGGSHDVAVAAGVMVTGIDFGNQFFTSSLSGRAWWDVDGDGLFDATENGASGITIYLDLDNSGMLDTETEPFTITGADEPSTPLEDESGVYEFPNLSAGSYVIRQVSTSDFTQTYPVSFAGHTAVLAVDATVSNLHFGNQPQGSTVRGQKWLDANGNGTLDADGPTPERGLGGVLIFIDENKDGVPNVGEPITVTGVDDPLTSEIDEGGRFFIPHVQPGDYTLAEVIPAGFNQTYPPAGVHTGNMEPNQVVENQDFGNIGAPGSIGGRIWHDVNEDGTFNDGDDTLGSVVIRLFLSDGDSDFERGGDDRFVSQQNSTGDGYEFRMLTPAAYWIEVDERSSVLLGFGLTHGTNPRAITVTSAGYLDDRDFGFENLDEITVELNLAPGWNLFSLPFEPKEPSIQSIFTSGCSGDNPAFFGIVWGCRAPESGETPASIQTLVPLTGYWVYLHDSLRVCIPGYEITNPRLQLTAGWNLVGGVVDEAVPSHTRISSSPWTWNGRGFHIESRFHPTQGLWLNAGGNVSIPIGN